MANISVRSGSYQCQSGHSFQFGWSGIARSRSRSTGDIRWEKGQSFPETGQSIHMFVSNFHPTLAKCLSGHPGCIFVVVCWVTFKKRKQQIAKVEEVFDQSILQTQVWELDFHDLRKFPSLRSQPGPNLMDRNYLPRFHDSWKYPLLGRMPDLKQKEPAWRQGSLLRPPWSCTLFVVIERWWWRSWAVCAFFSVYVRRDAVLCWFLWITNCSL